MLGKIFCLVIYKDIDKFRSNYDKKNQKTIELQAHWKLKSYRIADPKPNFEPKKSE